MFILHWHNVVKACYIAILPKKENGPRQWLLKHFLAVVIQILIYLTPRGTTEKKSVVLLQRQASIESL